MRADAALQAARLEDLAQLEAMYRAVVAQMEADGAPIWDEVYPAVCFPEDIRMGRLYLLTEGAEILAAFALCQEPLEANHLGWTELEAKACVLERLAVHPKHRGEGLGSLAVRRAEDLAREKGARYLRLLVVDYNQPAIALYRRCGFRQVDGVYENVIDGDLTLMEYGFEKSL